MIKFKPPRTLIYTGRDLGVLKALSRYWKINPHKAVNRILRLVVKDIKNKGVV